MRSQPNPSHTTAWSAVGGALLVVGLSSIVALLMREPSKTHEPRFLLYAAGILTLTGFYLALAPLLTWWPWGSKTIATLGFALVIAAIALAGITNRGATSHTSVRHPRSYTSAARTTSQKSPPPTADGQPSIAPSSVLYRGEHLTVAVPRGWSVGEDEKEKSGEIESTWTNPAYPTDELLIDFKPASDLSLEEDAAPAHEELLREPGYRELYYASGDLQETPSWMWIFTGPQLEHVDYFFARCSTDFAVLGSSTPRRFAALRTTFRAAAESARANCH